MKEKHIRPTGVQFPLIYQAPINGEMDEYIKRAAWDMGKKELRKVSLAEYGRRRILPQGWEKQLLKWRQEQSDFDPSDFAGRKRLEVVNGANKTANAKRANRAYSALSKR